MPNRYSDATKKILFFLLEGPKYSGRHRRPAYPFLREIQDIFGENEGWHETERNQKVSKALWRLKKNRLIISKQKSNETFVVELTEKGKRTIKEFQFADLKIPAPKKWDGKWRIIIFDIPNKRNAGREALRNKIKELDFYQLQKSVWVFPYPCETEIEFITEFFHLYPYVQTIEATSIKNDIKLRKYYRLF